MRMIIFYLLIFYFLTGSNLETFISLFVIRDDPVKIGVLARFLIISGLLLSPVPVIALTNFISGHLIVSFGNDKIFIIYLDRSRKC